MPPAFLREVRFNESGWKGETYMKHEEIAFRTKKKLADSLKKQMQKKPFSKITVKDITEDCDVNRNTFYYHFEDIYTLLRWMFDNEAIHIVQSFDLLVDYDEAIAFVIDYIEKNDHIISCALDSIGQRELKRFFHTDFFDITNSLLDAAQRQSGISIDPEYKSYLATFYTDALAGMLIEWIQRRDSADKEQLVAYLTSTVKDSLYGIFQKSRYCRPSDENSVMPAHKGKTEESD